MSGLRAAGWAASGLIAIGASGLGLLSSQMPGARHDAIGGATFAALNDQRHSRELLVTSLRTGGDEEQAGLRVGDVIETINGRDVVTPATLRAEEARGSPAILRVRRQGDVMTVRLLETSQEAMREQNSDRRGR